MSYRKKLIDVAIPLDVISRASAREKTIRHGHPSTLHLWWARRPLAAARAVLWASLVDDPSEHADRFPTKRDQVAERRRLFGILERLVVWENSNDPHVLRAARVEIEASCDGELPNVVDPFCGGGTIPLEALRLGLPAFGGDLNPVAVLISKALVEIPARFSSFPPVNPAAHAGSVLATWDRVQGLADDIGFYGNWMRERAHERIGHLYPEATLPVDHGGGETNVIAWIWARTVQSPDPSWNGHVPLVRFWVLRRGGKIKPVVWVEPVVDRPTRTVRYRIREGGIPPNGTVRRGVGTCIATGAPIPSDYIRAEGQAGRMESQLIAVVAEGRRGRVYLSPETDVEPAIPCWKPVGQVPTPHHDVDRLPMYGMPTWADAFTSRQLVALTTFSDLLVDVRQMVRKHARAVGLEEDGVPLRDGGIGIAAYADAVTTYLALVVDKCADYWSSICSWHNGRELIRNTFGRQAIPMTWDYAEANPFSNSSGNWLGQVAWVQKTLAVVPDGRPGEISQRNASNRIREIHSPMICTDPPYYDNISYADLSDFFYIWLRHNVGDIWPDETATLLTPKSEEMIANPYRARSKEAARVHFEQMMADLLHQIAVSHNRAFPATIFYAYKQQEARAGSTISTGWETFLQALVNSELQITATWPIRTEMQSKIDKRAAKLASSVVIACRRRAAGASTVTRREFIDVLSAELPTAVRLLQDQAIAPVDMAQSAIGPGMEVFSRYAKVLEADGEPMRIRTALSLINEALEEILSAEETEFDSDTRWALTWYEQFGLYQGQFGDAETLAKAKNTSVEGVVRAGFAESRLGTVRLLTRDELDDGWDPLTDKRLTVWLVVQHLIARLEDSEVNAADLLRRVGGGMGDRARLLAYLLYQISDRKGWVYDAVAYNGLIRAWQGISRLAAGPRSQTFEGM